MEALAYGAVVGLSLGLTGGGGSIFAVPLLVFGLGYEFRKAVAVSLAVVGLTALYGAAIQARKGGVLWGAGAVLGAGGIVAAPLGAWVGGYLAPQLSLWLFAALMIVVGARMLRRGGSPGDVPLAWARCEIKPDGRPRFSWRCAAKLASAGAVTGVLAGIFGVGGGFLVVPALLLVTGAGIELALATSLVAISLVSASGFAANSGALAPGDAAGAIPFLAGAAVGMTGGAWAKRFVPPAWLQRGFGIAVICTALAIFALNR